MISANNNAQELSDRPNRKTNERLGEYFLRNKQISQEELQKSLRQKNKDNCPIGMALVRLGLVTEQDIAIAISHISGCEYIDGNTLETQKNVETKIPEHISRQYSVLPLALIDNRLHIATDRPLSKPVLRTLERVVRCPVVPKITPTTQLLRSIALTFTDDKIIDSDGASAIEIVNDLIIKAVKLKTSDIHLEPLEERVRLRYRIDGVLREMESLSHAQYISIASRIKVLARLNIAEKRSPQDGAISFEQNGIAVDLRVSVLPSLHGEKIVMRLLAGKAMQLTIDQIGLSASALEQFTTIVKRPYGIVMIVGPTGSGKSTTLCAALNTINNPQVNIVTVEDPVEYKIDGITQVHVGQSDKLTFAGALRSILRQDPDIIMVGETRDTETAQISLRAALTGHMVFTTLHTNDAPGALPRLIDMGCEPFLVSSSVSGILAQRLVRHLCPLCKEAYTPSQEQQEIAEAKDIRTDRQWFKAVGCEHCNTIGYRGRTGIFEFLEIDKDIQSAVMKGSPAEEIMSIAIKNGMITLRQDAVEKLDAGVTSFDEIIRVTIG